MAVVKKNGETPAKTIELATETTKAAVTKSFGQSVAALKDSMSGAVAGFEKSQAEVKANMEKAIKTTEELVAFSQGNVEAVMKSGQIWATGVQELSKSWAAQAQLHMDQTVATFKALSGVKSIKEAFDLQSTLARSSMEAAMAETGKLTDASIKLAEQAIAPITARVTLAVEKFGRAA